MLSLEHLCSLAVNPLNRSTKNDLSGHTCQGLPGPESNSVGPTLFGVVTRVETFGCVGPRGGGGG